MIHHGLRVFTTLLDPMLSKSLLHHSSSWCIKLLYFRGKVKNSLMGFDSNFGEKLTIPYKPNVALPVSINMVMPTLFSRSSSHNDDIDRALNFFTKERGSIAISQAICSTHRVDLQSNSASKFTQPFIEAIKGMHYYHTIQP